MIALNEIVDDKNNNDCLFNDNRERIDDCRRQSVCECFFDNNENVLSKVSAIDLINDCKKVFNIENLWQTIRKSFANRNAFIIYCVNDDLKSFAIDFDKQQNERQKQNIRTKMNEMRRSMNELKLVNWMTYSTMKIHNDKRNAKFVFFDANYKLVDIKSTIDDVKQNWLMRWCYQIVKCVMIKKLNCK